MTNHYIENKHYFFFYYLTLKKVSCNTRVYHHNKVNILKLSLFASHYAKGLNTLSQSSKLYYN